MQSAGYVPLSPSTTTNGERVRGMRYIDWPRLLDSVRATSDALRRLAETVAEEGPRSASFQLFKFGHELRKYHDRRGTSGTV